MTGTTKGILATVGTFLIWGFSPLYYKMLVHVPAAEVMAHRVIWSLVFFAALLAVQGRLGEVRGALRGRRQVAIVVAASVLISVNWFMLIYATQIDRVTELSLGYYIYPLVAVLAGRFLYGEHLSRLQVAAVAMAGAAVALLTWGLGVLPWISLSLAVTFGLYGILKKGLPVGPVVSVTAEVVVLMPVVALLLFAVYREGAGHFGGSMADTLLLIGAGPMTATPLILFSYAIRRVAMSTVGLMLYMNPTLQFFCAVVLFGEPFTRWHAVAFPAIWLALALFTWEALRQDLAARRAVARAAESS
ncbi:EamA family transporter RarD [Seohaeicola nanhaiensis]|uniref:EamA family transporter RarD n=1 Tax=Seohaeicola nanhaiensis TaxID=1387282 RepID=A0ABV9KK99_9RHOB